MSVTLLCVVLLQNQGHCVLIKNHCGQFKWNNAPAQIILTFSRVALLRRCFDSRQDMSLAVEPVSPCYLIRQDPPPTPHAPTPAVWLRPAVGGEVARERWVDKEQKAFLRFRPTPISRPDSPPLLLVERHVCPPLPTAEICLWCKHPCFVAMATKSPACCRLSCQPPPPCSSSPISNVL